MQNKLWQCLKPGDAVDVIAPAGRLAVEQLKQLIALLINWGLRVNVAEDIFGDDLLCANTDAARLRHLQEALLNPDTKAVICARGGYGATRLLPDLYPLPMPSHTKLFLGMSDITALHIFLQQQWRWATLHGSLSIWNFASSSIEQHRKILFGEIDRVNFTVVEPLNAAAQQEAIIESVVIGGNLCLAQTSLGTSWQLDARGKIIFLEEVNERAYKVDRMLTHLKQADLFSQAQAVIFGDFTGGAEPNGTSLMQPVLQRFAESLSIPAVQIKGVGHDKINDPLPLGVRTLLRLGLKPDLQLYL